MKYIFASHNQGKVNEMRHLFSDINWVGLSQLTSEVPEETGSTFVENALIKARFAAKLSGLPAIADDSGLVVDALNGAPGVYAARYAGDDANFDKNNQKLLREMQDVPEENRGAYYVSVLVFLKHANDPLPKIATGLWHGSIYHKALGENGFGYDPVFWIPQYAKTVAQLDDEVKNKISHRAKAVGILKELLK